MLAEIDNEWLRFAARNPGRRLADFIDKPALLEQWLSRFPTQKMHIALYVHGALFSKGGIERLAAQLSSFWLRRGHRVDLYCRMWGGDKPVYPLDSNVRIFPCFDEHDLPGSIARLRSLLAESLPDIFVPVLSEYLFAPVVDAALGLGFPIAVSEHNDPWVISEKWWNPQERIECFAKVDGIHLLFDQYRASLPEAFAPRIRVIANGIRTDLPPPLPRPKPGPRIIGVARFAAQKRVDRLIKGFASIAARYPDWSLVLFGDGPLRADVESLVKTSGFADRIHLAGEIDQIEAEYAASDIFVSPSEFEGFPIVLLEAKRAGLPLVGYRACNGVNALIHHEIDGLLVEGDSAENLGEAIARLIDDAGLRERLGAHAKADIGGYAIDAVAAQWEGWLSELITRSKDSDHWRAALQWPGFQAEAEEAAAPTASAPLIEPAPPPQLGFDASPGYEGVTLSARHFVAPHRNWDRISLKLQSLDGNWRVELRPNDSAIPLFDPTRPDGIDRWGPYRHIGFTPADGAHSALLAAGIRADFAEDIAALIQAAAAALTADPSLAPSPEQATHWLAILTQTGTIHTKTQTKAPQ